ncbi:hypothetical protein FACS1894176_02840 [Bacteroidia bacterium]|nr:hypothetical protein FACS1894176_02840 [Bacteroidia bacterium]
MRELINARNRHRDRAAKGGAVLDLSKSGNLGLILPRVALTATNEPSPMSAFVSGMMVYNVRNAGSGDTHVFASTI